MMLWDHSDVKSRESHIGIGTDGQSGGFSALEFGGADGGDHRGVVTGEDEFGIVEAQAGFGGFFREIFLQSAVGGDAAGNHQ